MRVAALYDVHGNLPALEAVLREAGGADVVVVGGDVASGPLPAETLDRLRALDVPVRWVRGNADREVLDGRDAWCAARVSARHRALLARFEATVELDGVVYCHGTPRSDEEIVTAVTPDARLAEVLAGVEAELVVGGHTHRQFRRGRYVNAGSVGLPYEGRAAAFWLEVTDGEPRFRETAYDVEAALATLRASGYPDVDEWMGESLVSPTDPDEVARSFEALAAS